MHFSARSDLQFAHVNHLNDKNDVSRLDTMMFPVLTMYV